MLGMPATVTVELTGLWHREVELVGCYAYGTEVRADGRLTTSFELATELAGKVAFDRLVGRRCTPSTATWTPWATLQKRDAAARSRSHSTCGMSAGVASDRRNAADSNGSPASSFDAVVIGAGVIGAATAFELGRRGRRVLCVDKLPAAGFGSTVNSCAIVRFTYSTYTGVAMAYEGLQYWLDWPAYLEASDELGLIEYKQCGMATLKDPGGHYLKVLPHFDAIGVAYEEWSTDELVQRMPILDAGVFGPPKRPDDPDFWADPTEQLPGAVFTPEAGYVSDPQLTTHNLQRAAEAAGAEFRFGTAVTAIGHAGGRVTGVTLDGDTTVAARWW